MCRIAASLDHTQNKAHDNVREIFMIRVRSEGGCKPRNIGNVLLARF